MALDTLRAAVWPPSDVPLDRAGRRLPGWRDRPVCIELYYRWCDRWFHSGMAVDSGGVVCAADGVPADRWMIFCVMEIWKTAARADGKAIHNLMEKRQAFFHRSANSFPTASQSWQFTHIPTTPTTAAIYPITKFKVKYRE